MKTSRLAFADNIRTLLICQVIMVHAAVTYGGEGGWYFEEETHNTATIIGLTLFNAISQSFFMSLLFLIAGFFSWQSLANKSSMPHYISTRIVRLGIPLMVFYFVIGPLTLWLSLHIEGESDFTYLTSLHAGPMWFAQALLLFTAAYLVFQLIAKNKTLRIKSQYFTWFPVCLFILLLWLITIVARAYWPMGSGLAGMQLGSFGHYSLMFCSGLFAAKIDWQAWLNSVDRRLLNRVAIIGILILPVGLVLGFSPEREFEPFMGGLSWQAISYAAWESCMCVLLSIWVVHTLYRSKGFKSKIWRMMGRANYGVYFLHAPILVAISWGLLPLPLPPIVKFVIASCATIALTFPIAWLLTRLPLIKQIL